MTSKVQICNLALAHIGQKSVASLDEASVPATYLNLYYEAARDAALRDYNWNFATKTIALADLGTPDRDDYDYMYSFPSACARVRQILPAVKGDTPPAFEVGIITDSDDNDTKVIFTDKADAVAVYTKIVTNTELYDPLFVRAFSHRLAADVAFLITKDMDRQKTQETMYQNVIRAAWSADANEGQAETPADPSWIEARL